MDASCGLVGLGGASSQLPDEPQLYRHSPVADTAGATLPYAARERVEQPQRRATYEHRQHSEAETEHGDDGGKGEDLSLIHI